MTPQIISLTIQGIVNLTSLKAEEDSEDKSLDDAEFECLETLLNKMHSNSAAYPQDLKEELASALINRFRVE